MSKLYEGIAEMWWEAPHAVRRKQFTCTVNLQGESKKRPERCVVGDSYLPLNGPYEIFTYKNTREINGGDSMSSAILNAFDSVHCKVGYCYTNAKELLNALKSAGVNATPYVGWAFMDGHSYPVHHCWLVVECGGFQSLLDLSDDGTMLTYLARVNGADMETYDGQKKALADFMDLMKRENIPNRSRCVPVGQPTPYMLYIGSPCDPDEGRKIYRNLIKEFPDHKCERNCVNGRNETQTYLRERGLDEI